MDLVIAQLEILMLPLPEMDSLYAAAIAGDADAIATLEMEADRVDEDEQTILHIESINGNTERVRFILKVFAHKNLLVKLDNQEKTALTWAAYYGHTEMVEVLIDAARHLKPLSFQAFLRHADTWLDTALHLAVEYGHTSIVKLLVEADPSGTYLQNRVGKTPMYLAVEEGYNNIVEIISTTCTAPSLDGPNGSTVVRVENLDQAENPGGTLYQIKGKDGLYAAAISGDADAIAKLEMQADKLMNAYGETILHAESREGNIEHVRFILREFASKNLLVKLGNQKETALTWAAYFGHIDVVEVLINAARHLPPAANDNLITSFQAFLRHADQDSETALHSAVKKCHPSIVKLLVDADPSDTHTQNDRGETPMYIAVEKGFNDIVEIISTTCTAPSLDGPHGSAVVCIKNLEEANSLGGSLYKIMYKDVLYAAAIDGDADATARLEMKADRLNKDDQTILHVESINGNTDHVRFILREFASKNLLVKLDDQERTALTWAAYFGYTEVVEVLIEEARHLPHTSSANDNLITSFQDFLRHADKDSETALHVAVKEGHVDIVKLLVEADPSDRHSQNKKGKTPMYIAAKKGYNNIVKVMCTTCTAPSLEGPDGSTALHAAIKHLDHDIEVVNILVSAARNHDIQVDNDDDDDDAVTPFQAVLRQGDHKDMNTALHIAVMQGNLATAKLLVEADPSDTVHLKNEKGETPIYIAAERGNYDIMKMIFTTCTAPPDLEAPGGTTTVLHGVIKNLHKAKKEDKDVIKICIDGVRRTLKMDEEYSLFGTIDESKRTILELALDENQVNVVELILKENQVYHNLDSWEYNSHLIGLMPLIYRAVEKDYNEIVKLLVNTYQIGAEMCSSHHTKDMVHLISAIKNRNRDSVLNLLDRDCGNLAIKTDSLGWTPLHHAAYYQFDSIIDRILKVQKWYRYTFHYREMVSTPLLIAAEKGYTSTLKCLMEGWPSSSSWAYVSFDRNRQNILHLAALQRNKEMIQNILNQCPQQYKDEIVNKQDKNGNTPLHLLIACGCFVPEFMKYKGLDIMLKNKEMLTPEDMLYSDDQIIGDQVQIKIELDKFETSESLVLPTKRQRKDAMFIERMKEELERYKTFHTVAQLFADAIKGNSIAKAALLEAHKPNEVRGTILHVESKKGDIENVRFILEEFANENLLVKLDRSKQTALHLAAQHGHTQVVEVLIDAAKRNLPSSAANLDDPVSPFNAFIRQATAQKRNTALHKAVSKGNLGIVKLLLEADPSDRHIQNVEGKTPIYMAAEKGYKSIIKEICTTCAAQSLDGPDGRTTALHDFVRNVKQVTEGATDVIRMMVNAAKRWSIVDASLVNFEALFSRTDESGSTVLQVAMKRNYVDAVKLILLEDPAYQPAGRGIKRNGLMRLIYEAIDNQYSNDIIKLLSETYKAGIDPDHKDVLDLILAMKRRDEDSVLRLLGNAEKLVTFAEDNGWTPLHYAVYHEFDSILGPLIVAHENVGHEFVYGNTVITPFHVAVKHGYTSTMIRLMQSWPAPSSGVTAAAYSPYTAVDENGRNILHLAAVLDNKHLAAVAEDDYKAADNKKKMVQGILKYCPKEFKDEILKQKDTNGDTPLHLLISHGCFIPELIKPEELNTMARNKNKFTPWDMLYFKSDVVADQVHIKIALDEVQTNQPAWNLRPKSTEKKTDIFTSIVPESQRRIKDVIFEESEKLLRDAEHEKMKNELEVYKKRTNTQIIVAALITTVTFTVGFTMPGGLRQSGEVDEGLVLLSKKKAFTAFMVSDALALLLSTSSLFFYFLESLSEDPSQVWKLNTASTVFNIVSVLAMMLTFITGTYVVLSHSPAIAITVCVIGSLFFPLLIVLLIKTVIGRHKVKRNKY